MALANLSGLCVPVGPSFFLNNGTVPGGNSTTIDAAAEASIMIGQIVTADGASHTIDTTGSSAIGWLTSTVTFANAGTSVSIGLAAVLTSAGPPGRAANVADVITFDVTSVKVGGGGGITGSAWQSSVPTVGTKTVANGDLVALGIQMTARGGADSILVVTTNAAASNAFPICTDFTGGAYALIGAIPNALITFSDGVLGWFYGAAPLSANATRTWNSGSATKEYGQLYQLPFPVKVLGLYGWVNPTADFDVVLYSDPLGTPVAEKTFSVDANWVGIASGRRFETMFASPYSVAANTPIGAIFKPGGSNISAYYKTIANAANRVTDIGQENGYGINRASGAFANENSSLSHYYIGLLVSAFDAGGSSGGGVIGG